jgi:hypothetical protein
LHPKELKNSTFFKGIFQEFSNVIWKKKFIDGTTSSAKTLKVNVKERTVGWVMKLNNFFVKFFFKT